MNKMQKHQELYDCGYAVKQRTSKQQAGSHECSDPLAKRRTGDHGYAITKNSKGGNLLDETIDFD